LMESLTTQLLQISTLRLCSLKMMDLKESEWMNLNRFKGKSCVFFLRDLKVKVSRYEGKICESLW